MQATNHHLNDTYLIAIYAKNSQFLYRSFRDYLVFLSLIRELVQTTDTTIYGFSWLPKQSMHIVTCHESHFVDHWIAIMKRYCYWLQLVADPQNQFVIRVIKIADIHEAKEALKHLHLRVCSCLDMPDPLAYHWHSLPVYHQYWDMPWVNSETLLTAYSSNPILSRDGFRHHMMTPATIDFEEQLAKHNIVLDHVSDPENPRLPVAVEVQESKTRYHQQMMQQTHVLLMIRGDDLEITVHYQNE